jgi:hypothetical protein
VPERIVCSTPLRSSQNPHRFGNPALDPSLVDDRGANAHFVEQEAENAVTDGTIIGPARTAYTLPAEASGRAAVKLLPGQYVEFTLPQAATAITVQ